MAVEIYAPILIIGFNRPDIISKTFEYVKQAKPRKLYVSIDGPRKSNYDDIGLIESVKSVVKSINWNCEVEYKFHSENVGAELNVSSAISWVLQEEDKVIVLEDDIIAPLSFLRFAQDMLIRYSKDENVYMVTGGQFTPIILPNNEDYLFGYYGHTGCGWATWKRAWDKFDLNVNDFDEFLSSKVLGSITQSRSEKRHVEKKISLMKKTGDGNNSWDSCWSYIRLKENGLSIIPRINLTSNIGIFGLHAKGISSTHYRKFDETFEAKIHPSFIKQNLQYDNYHFSKHIKKKKPLFKRIIKKLFNIKSS